MIEVINTAPSPWPEGVQVWIMNKNPIPTPPIYFDGKPYEFPPGEAVAISPEHAYASFAWDCRCAPGQTPKLRRDKMFGKRYNNDTSHYDDCMLSLGCANTREGREWFENFDATLEKVGKKINAKSFAELKSRNG